MYSNTCLLLFSSIFMAYENKERKRSRGTFIGKLDKKLAHQSANISQGSGMFLNPIGSPCTPGKEVDVN